MIKILQKNHPTLRKKAKEVLVKDIASVKIKRIIKNMAAALEKEPDGVALAAPQIGQPLRIFIVAKDKLSNGRDSATGPPAGGEFMVFINPKILKISRKKQLLQEGCLSVRGFFGYVRRAEKLTVEAYDENGKKFIRGASNLLSEIIQHEIDHLNGLLFTDKAEDLKKINAYDNLGKDQPSEQEE